MPVSSVFLQDALGNFTLRSQNSGEWGRYISVT